MCVLNIDRIEIDTEHATISQFTIISHTKDERKRVKWPAQFMCTLVAASHFLSSNIIVAPAAVAATGGYGWRTGDTL